MYERDIRRAEVEEVIAAGKLIKAYPTDRPFPSYLFLAFPGGRPLHVLLAHDAARHHCLVVTVYKSDPAQWNADFTQRTKRV